MAKPDWRQAFLDAMAVIEGCEFEEWEFTDNDWEEFQRLRAMRDAAKGDKTNA